MRRSQQSKPEQTTVSGSVSNTFQARPFTDSSSTLEHDSTPLSESYDFAQIPLMPVVQSKSKEIGDYTEAQDQQSQSKSENQTGMPDTLKAGLEQMSGIDLSDVQVHRNSSKPAELGALAYAQGQDIYLGPGQEKHLPHEGWHVVQQMQGRVEPTSHSHNTEINDDHELEKEADQMGAKASQSSGNQQVGGEINPGIQQGAYAAQMQSPVVQRVAPAFAGLSAAAWGVAANVASVVGTASSVAAAGYSAVAKGESDVASLILPANQMSDGDEGKLRQIARYRIINAYVDRYISTHPEVLDQLYPVYGPALPPGFQDSEGDTEQGGSEDTGSSASQAESAERPTGAPTTSDIDEVVMQQVKDAIENDLKIEMETAVEVGSSTIEFKWGEDDTRGRGVGEGNSGSSESVGVTGYLRFRDLEGSILKETLDLSGDAKAAIGNVPNEGEEMLVHRFIGGSIGGVVSYSYLQDLAVNVEGGGVQVGVAANGSPKLIARTHWYWDRWGANVDTYMRNEISVMDDGTINITESREGSPNDEPWASEPDEDSYSLGTQIPEDR